MTVADTPVKIIRASIRSFLYACLLDNAVQEERITPTSFPDELRLWEEKKWVQLKTTYTGDQFKAETRTLVRITLGTTAMSVNKALEVVYGKKFDPADTSPQGSARVLLYQIRCAFAHDPLNPVWTPNIENYNHEYRVAVKITPTGEPAITYSIPFHPPSLRGQPLRPEHIGGLGGYLGLLHYYLGEVEAHPKGNQRYSPSAEES